MLRFTIERRGLIPSAKLLGEIGGKKVEFTKAFDIGLLILT